MLFFNYVLRKVVRRAGNNALTIVVIGFVLAGCMLGVTFLTGLRFVAHDTLPADHVLVTAQGASNEHQNMGLSLEVYNLLQVLPEVNMLDERRRAVSPEVVAQILLDPAITNSDFEEGQIVRGVDAIGYELHGIQLREGRLPDPSAPELVVGAQLMQRYPALRPGAKVQLPGEAWEIVGVFSNGGSVYEGELWGDRMRMTKPLRQERLNSVLLATKTPADAAALVTSINNTKRFEATAHLEQEFRGSQAKLAQVSRVILILVVGLCLIGVFVTATNLHAALMTRLPEFASLIALGVRRRRVALIVILESLLLSAFGVVLALGLAFLAHGRSSALFNAGAVFQLRLGTLAIGLGLVLAVVLGILGGLFPALIVRRLDLRDGLR